MDPPRSGKSHACSGAAAMLSWSLVAKAFKCRLTSFPGTGSQCLPRVTRALPVDPLPTTPDWPKAPARPTRRPRRAPSPVLGTSRGRDGLRQCCCPVPRQGQGATASVLAGLRLSAVPRWVFCFVSNNDGEEATLCMAAWAQFFAVHTPLCWEALPAFCVCGLKVQAGRAVI